MKIFAALIISFASIMAIPARADDYVTYKERYELAQGAAYDTIVDMCSPNGQTSIMVFVGAGMVHSWNMFEEIDKADEIAPEVKGILESEDYERALTSCFGDDRNAKNHFTQKLLFASGAGSFSVVYGVGKAFQGISAGLGSLGGWIGRTAWAGRNIRLAALSVKSIKTLRFALDYGPFIPPTLMASEIWVLELCKKVDECWNYYSKIKVNGELKELQEAGINPLAEFEYEIMLGLRDQITHLERLRLQLAIDRKLTPAIDKEISERIQARRLRIDELSKSSGFTLQD